MKGLGLAGFTAYFVFWLWMWVRQWRAGEISRFPAFATIYRDKAPGRFKFWTIVHAGIFLAMFALVMLAWWAFFTGNLK